MPKYEQPDSLNRLREPAILFGIQVVQYSVVCFSYRALAQANIPVTVGIDLLYAALQFAPIQRVASAAKGWLSQSSYALGSAAGTWLGIVISLRVLGK